MREGPHSFSSFLSISLWYMLVVPKLTKNRSEINFISRLTRHPLLFEAELFVNILNENYNLVGLMISFLLNMKHDHRLNYGKGNWIQSGYFEFGACINNCWKLLCNSFMSCELCRCWLLVLF